MSSATWMLWFLAMALFTFALLALGFALLSGAVKLPRRRATGRAATDADLTDDRAEGATADPGRAAAPAAHRDAA